MAVTASQLDKTVLLRKARARLYNGILDHDQEKVRKAIAEIQKLGGDLNQPWSKPADGNEDVRPAIVLAAYNHNLEAMRLLLNTNTIDLDLEVQGKVPIMVHVCRAGDERVVDRLLRSGASLNVQASFNSQPLDAAFFASMQFDYSLVFHSDWGDLALKNQLIAWWEGKEFTPSAPLKARWPGAIPLVACLLKEGANPAVEKSSGLSPLKVVRDPRCVLENDETRMEVELNRVKLLGIKDDILTFKVILQSRTNEKTLNIMVEVDYNMPLPEDVDKRVTSSIVDIYQKNRTMRGLIEAYAPKDKFSHSSDDLLDMKLRIERVEISTRDMKEKMEVVEVSTSRAVAQAKVALQSAEEVKILKEGFTQLCDQHVVVYEEFQDRKAYQERLTAVKKDKGSPVYAFFDTVSKELDRLFSTYKLLMKDPEKFDKTEAASKVIGALANFAPAPFNAPAHAIAVLVNVYGQYRLRQEQSRVIDLLERDHGPMCDDLALRLTEHYKTQLADMEPEKAKKLAQNAVGVMFALMCDSEKTINPLDSSQAIQDQLFEAVKTSDFFSRKLKEHLQPSKPRSMLPSFSSKPTPSPVAPPRSASQPPGPRAVKKPEDPLKTSKSSILSAFSRSKSPKPQTVVSPVTSPSGEGCNLTVPSPMRKPPIVLQSVK